jgi:hypothetical protein
LSSVNIKENQDFLQMIPLYIIKGEKRRPDQAGTPGSAHAAPVEPAAGQPVSRSAGQPVSREKGKAADPVRRSAALSKS